MNIFLKISVLSFLSLSLSNCITTNWGDGEKIASNTLASSAAKKDITYSVTVYNEQVDSSGNGAYGAVTADVQDYANYIERALKESERFRTITFKESANKGQNHYHFTVRLYEKESEGQARRDVAAFVGSGANLGFGTIFPVWGTATADYRLTITESGKNCSQLKSEQYYRNYHWFPLVLGYPFAAPDDSAEEMTERAVRHLLYQHQH